MKIRDLITRILNPSSEAPVATADERPAPSGFQISQTEIGTIEPPEFPDPLDDDDDTFDAETVGLFHDDDDDPYAVPPVSQSKPTGRKWDQLREAAAANSQDDDKALYDRYARGEDQPEWVPDTRWRSVGRQFDQDMTRENTPNEFVPGTSAYYRAHM